jgi:hypothetical protein
MIGIELYEYAKQIKTTQHDTWPYTKSLDKSTQGTS